MHQATVARLALIVCLFCCASFSVAAFAAEPSPYDVAIIGGRVVDPQHHRDEIINLAIRDGRVAWLGKDDVNARLRIDASGLIVAPGFVDLHSHAITDRGQYFQGFDGVTTTLELEAGAYPVGSVNDWYPSGARLHHGASVSLLAIRHRVLGNVRQPHFTDPVRPLDESNEASPRAAFSQRASKAQVRLIAEAVDEGLQAGGIGIGLPIDYMHGAVSDEELHAVFTVASKYKAPIFIHLTRGLPGDLAGLERMIAMARDTGAAIHICHLQASVMGGVGQALALIREARAQGLQVTHEAYPYNAGSTQIGASVFGRDWQQIFDIDHEDVQWAETGERLTQTSFAEKRAGSPTGFVIHHYGRSEWTNTVLSDPNTIVASDAMPIHQQTRFAHPRGMGTFTRLISRHVDEFDAEGALTLADAISRMTVQPAAVLTRLSPRFAFKGQLGVGADADVAILDPTTLRDRATYLQPLQAATGVRWLLVCGEALIAEGEISASAHPGKNLSQSARSQTCGSD